MLDGIALQESDKGLPCPNPFRDPPCEALRTAQSLHKSREGFQGRVGALVFARAGELYAVYAEEPAPTLPNDYRQLTESLLWSSMPFHELPDCDFIDGKGQSFLLRDFVREGLNRYPCNDRDHGGQEATWRRGVYIHAMYVAVGSPSVRLLQMFHRHRLDERLVALGEWWRGATSPHDVRFDGTFYAPRSSGKALIERLLVGHEIHTPLPTVPPTIDVLYEDASLLIVDKPSRLASVPSAAESMDCLSLMRRDFGPLFDVHRLDRATSGVLVFAKTRRMQRLLQEAFRSGQVHKRYVALLDGVVKTDAGEISLPLGVNRLDRPRQCVLSPYCGAKDAATRFEVMSRREQGGKWHTLVALYPETGRTHQLRVHCAHRLGLNAPIVGDAFYGKDGLINESLAQEMFLHAARIRLRHPDTQQWLVVEAPGRF